MHSNQQRTAFQRCKVLGGSLIRFMPGELIFVKALKPAQRSWRPQESTSDPQICCGQHQTQFPVKLPSQAGEGPLASSVRYTTPSGAPCKFCQAQNLGALQNRPMGTGSPR